MQPDKGKCRLDEEMESALIYATGVWLEAGRKLSEFDSQESPIGAEARFRTLARLASYQPGPQPRH